MRHLSALPLFFVAAMAPAQQFAAPPYRALGTEPFWSLTIGDGLIRLEEPGKQPVIVTAPVPRPTFNGRRYDTRGLTVDIARTPCSDGMSDRRYPETVIVGTGRRTLRGCGGAPTGGEVGPTRLENSNWTVEAIDGRRVTLDRPVQIGFSADRITGYAGCNRFGGQYRLTGDRLDTDKVFATRMACPGQGMQIETRFLALLEQPLRIRQIGHNTLMLTTRDGNLTLTRAR